MLLRISSVLAPTPEYTPDRIPEGARMDALTASIPIACRFRENASTISSISSDAQMLGALFERSNSTIPAANIALANVSP